MSAEYVNARTERGKHVHHWRVHRELGTASSACEYLYVITRIKVTADPVDCKTCLRVMAKAGKAVEP